MILFDYILSKGLFQICVFNVFTKINVKTDKPFRGQKNYRKLDIENPLESKLFNSKRSVKFIVPGYTTSGATGSTFFRFIKITCI